MKTILRRSGLFAAMALAALLAVALPAQAQTKWRLAL